MVTTVWVTEGHEGIRRGEKKKKRISGRNIFQRKGDIPVVVFYFL